ncbi:MAG TPA: hypothetical protein VG722_04690 [Tepidisphaeraceae bacterium]|nr:hypothetical protein [Tepidisphaeraceae bacterium]
MGNVAAQRAPSSLQRLLGLNLIVSANTEALEMAVDALHAPLPRRFEKAGRANWRQRCERAAEGLIKLFPNADPERLEQTRNILRQASIRIPSLDDARLLADTMNLDDFGIAALLQHTLQMGANGADLVQLLNSFSQREQYGYWDARLKEDFHFEQVRQLAAARLENVRKLLATLKAEGE